MFWPWVRVQRQGAVGCRAGGGDSPDAARSLQLLTIIHIEPAFCQDPLISRSLSLCVSFNLTAPVYSPFYFPICVICVFHATAFLSIAIRLYNSLSVSSPLFHLSLSLSISLSLSRYRWTHLQVNLNSWRCIISILLLLHICSDFPPFLSELIIHNQPTKDVDVS